ncbi:msx2-interacting protein isoform X5 [Gallus gallus]|uniref:msx2-interacting protein isoform X5 n=1 Tax=Gallus gallus TaxID=9031 RepID=UPI000739CDD6|nr:msx2-interacting protein isoform X5 [Gallus gallus]|eukprot:XP_015152495.1 msx2-interacting protein isoform X4 [Gallus gallus]
MVRETRHLWVGNLPENVREEKIIEHFKRYGRVESVKILPKRGSEGGVAAFVDFVDIKSAQKAHNSVNKMGDRDLRTDYNEPGTIPSAARGLDDTVSIASRSREVSGFRGGGGGPTYGPPPSLHAREGRYERRLDGASDNRERAYEHSAYGHHERGTGGFDRTRHYDQDYYRDPRERTLQHGLYYTSRSRSPNRFDAHDPRYEPRAREQFTLPSVVHRDIYRDDITREVRGRRPERNYQHSRSRSPHSSQSRTQSPQRLASQASRPTRSPSGSGSRSRSSSSDSISSSSSTSSDSSDSSSSSSDESPARSVQSTAVPAPASQLLPSLEKDEPRKSFGIKVQNLPVRSTDTSLKDGLFHEFKKYGKVTSVQIHGASEERYGLVFFRQQEDQEKALNASKGKLFFGMQIEVTAWIGPETESENEFRPLDERIDEFHPKATRTLFIGNLEKTTTYHDLRNIFQRFGGIVDIDIKKVNGVPQYAFLQYCDIASVCKAIKKMDGEYLGNNRLKLGFGKSMPTNCVWLDGLSTNVTDQYLTRHFCRYGPVVKVDFANRESQLAFYHSMEKTGQDIRDFYEMLAERSRDERRGSYEYAPDRTYYETVRTPGTYPEDPRREYPARGREFYAEWDPYQGDYYDPRYYDDPREYRDYRGDPYEQDIREYSYRQRERERERERFESDRDRDHERRPIERSQSPTHSRRPQSPGASPSQSERLQSDSERRIYSRSSDRSGSCSSLSPPRYDKLDKARVERYTKNEKTEKERAFDQERADKDKRLVRKEKPEKLEKEKTDKQKRKAKIHSPSSQSSETDQENEREPSPEKLKGNSKQSKDRGDKEGTAKNRLELMPCVVLTRVKEKEGKVIDQPTLEKLRAKLDNDTMKTPLLEQKTQTSQAEQTKSDQSKLEPVRTKVQKEKALASHIEVVDKEGKMKPKKHLKTEQTSEGANAVDLDKLEARKRRFADANLKLDRQKLEAKRGSQDEEDARVALKKQLDATASSREATMLREGELERKPLRKELLKRESKKMRLERLIPGTSPKEIQETLNVGGIGMRPTLDLQARLIEAADEPVEIQELPSKKLNPVKSQHKQAQLLDDHGTEREDTKKNYSGLPEDTPDHKLGQEKPQSTETEEKIGIDIDHTQSYRKQMEQSRRLKQQLEMEIAKSEKFGSPKKDVDEYERRSLVHEVGKPPQDVTDDSPPSKRKKADQFDFEISTKRERNYRSSRQVSEDSERTSCSPSIRQFPFHEDDDTLDSPRLIPLKETKESPKIEEKGLSYSNMTVREDSLKFNPYDSSRREQMAEMAKIKLSVLSSEDDSSRWETQVKQEPGRVDISFPSSIVKRDGIRKRSVRDLEPGEVPSDSDDDSENKPHSPKASSLLEGSRLSFLLRDREEKLREREERLSSSLERNKFYSFALDKTITPDTKALLERAKSLSSSREENWSFLDWDSRFASFRNNKDKEKVDSAPRPIPSWYMKKKKIRTDSEGGKLDDKKEDHKEEEQERQELFASRFLHSSIFEQDSKRLQHLERKDDDLDFISGRLYGRQSSSDGTNSAADLVQEPVVLFHSRFIELTRMQQKEKEKDQKPKEVEKQEDKENRPKTPETVPDSKEPEHKTSSVAGPSSVAALPQEPTPVASEKVVEKIVVETTSVKEEKPSEPVSTAEEQKPFPELAAPVKMEPPEQTEPPPVSEASKDVPTAVAPEEDAVATEHPSYLDTKPPTPGASFSQVDISVDAEPESAQLIPPPPKQVQKPDEAAEPKEENPLPPASTDAGASQKAEAAAEVLPPVSDNDMEVEPPVVVKDKKSYKSKRSKTPVQSAAASVTEKPVTRKSERIDREKLKRSSSPRGEVQKLSELKVEAEKVSRNAAKSPSSAAEPENVEPSLPIGRTRRRNVRSVYATTGDNEGPSPVKDFVEVTRSTRKRGEKEPQEMVTTVPTTPRRGRPPKTRRKPEEDISPIKTEPVQQEVEETEAKEAAEAPKPVEGWRSPRSQKLTHSHSSAATGQQGKKGKNEPKADTSAESEDAAERSGQESNVSDNSNKAKANEKELAASEQKRDRKEVDAEKNQLEISTVEMTEKKPVPEKVTKSKRGRYKNTKTVVDKASVCLKNVEIRLNVDEVKGALRPAEEEAEPMAVSPAKIKSPQKEDILPPHFAKNEVEDSFQETEKEVMREPKQSPEAAQLAKQIELEQAVEHIAKLTETPPSITAYKEPTADVHEVRQEEEGDKPAHQASETELAAAIGSIINDISGETESFPAPPTYPTESEAEIPSEPLVLPSPREEMEPETDQAVNNILEAEAAVEAPVQPVASSAPLAVETESKDTEVSFSESSNSAQETETLQEAEVARKEKGRQKATRQRRKRSTGRKGDVAEVNAYEPERVQSRSPPASEIKAKPEEALKEEKQPKAATQVSVEPSAADGSKAASTDIIVDVPEAAAESSASPKAPAPAPLDLPAPLASADEGSQSSFKIRSPIENTPITPPSVPSAAVPTIPLAAVAKLPAAVPAAIVPLHSGAAKVPEWIVRHEEPRARSTPPPALPPDTKASDIDTNSSTLRKILMEPKYVSATSITSTHVTTTHVEPVSAPRLEEAPLHPVVEAIKPVSEEKPAVPITNALDPPVAEAPVFSEKEKISTVIAPKATSVISRMPHSVDLEEAPRITLVKQAPQTQTCLVNAPSPKFKQRSSSNDNSRFHPGSMSVIEDRPVETGSSPGLRVNTSEGVVLLSYSGQKTEGPQRISAKISQIPPASAVDIEFQQSVSKSQIKQEPITPSQPTPKGSQASTGYGTVSTHSPLVLGTQPYNMSPVISSVKQERVALEKSDSAHLPAQPAASQPGKVLTQTVNTPPVLVVNKKLPDPAALKVETKTLQPSNLSPGVSPHHPSLSGKMHSEANHVSSGPSTPTDRAISHLAVTKQEPHSPRTSGHSPSPFPRTCHPGSTSSPALSSSTPVMLAPGIPVPQYISSMHPEQSVIMPPHSVTQTVSLGHLSQGEVRMNTPPLSGISYGIRPEALHSPRAALQPQIEIKPQRSSTPQPAPIRDIVMPPLSSQHPPEEEMHYHHTTVCRGPAPVQPDVLVMQPDYRMHPTSIRLEQYNVPRDVRMIMHPHMAAVGEHHSESRQSRTPEGAGKTPPVSKTPQPGKETPKSSEGKMAHSPHSEPRLLSVPSSSQLPGLPLTQPVVVPHGVQIMHPTGSSFHDYRSVYGDMRNYHTAAQLGHPQFPGASPIGLPSRSMTPSQGLPEGEHSHPSQPGRSKTPQISQDPKGPPASGPEQSHHPTVNRHAAQIDPHVHLQRAQADTGQTSYPSPVAISMKQELPSPHQAQAVPKQSLFIPTTSGPGAPPGLPLNRPEPQAALKQEPSPHPVSQRPVDMVQLLTKYPIVWQGLLALKNDTAAVQLHFVSGNNVLAHRSLPAPEGGPPLRIAQRMRLEASQLEGVARRMMVESDYCLLLALPCGRDQEDVVNQTESLKAAFISYLQAKQAAGIINVPNPGSNQPAYVLQIFPPCEFSESHLSRLAPDLLASISNISPHLMIVIASLETCCDALDVLTHTNTRRGLNAGPGNFC